MRKQTAFFSENKQLRAICIPDLIRHGILAWLIAAAAEYLLLPGDLRGLSGLDGLARMSLPRVLALTVGLTLLLAGLSRGRRIRAAERRGIAAVFGLSAAAALAASPSPAFLAVCLLILAALILFALCGWDARPEPLCAPSRARRAWKMTVALLALLLFLFLCAWTVGRVYSFCTPTFDFGIFAQMFFSMKESGLPITTLERDGLLSHFAVHVSPIWYLMLPFYCLVPTPATLQVLQAAVTVSAVIPLWRLGGRHGLGSGERTLLCAALLLYPAFSGGVSYDVHENCFLTPLLLWLFYAIDTDSIPGIALSAALTLLVKEDAAVYVAVTGLWLTVQTLLRSRKARGRRLAAGSLLLAASLAWFFLVTGFLASRGDGVMTWRYNNFMYDGSSSLLTVVKSVLLSPMKAVFECVQPEKLRFIALTLLPLLGLPLLTRRYERFLLLIPYVLVNLMPDYQYQHDIFFQYTFGSNAFLFYLALVNLADWGPRRPRVLALGAAAAAGAVCFGVLIVPKGIRYPVQSLARRAQYERIYELLDTIPEDASAAATTFYTTALSQRGILYDVRHCSKEHLLESEYVVLNPSADRDYQNYASEDGENGYANLTALLKENGYRETASLDRRLVIYQKQ